MNGKMIMNGKNVRIWKEVVLVYFVRIYWGRPRKIWVRIMGKSTEIKNGDLL